MTTYYIAPSGSDTTGNGTQTYPWLTIQKWIDSAPAAGETLYCRGGTYTNPPVAQAGHGKPVLPGTVSAPVTISNYAGEVPIFSGPNANNGFLRLYDACTYVIVDGLEWEGRTVTDADLYSYQGMIVVGGWTDGVTYTTLHTTIRNNKFRHAAGYNSRGHALYLSGGVRYVTVEDCEFVGAIIGRTTNRSYGLQAYGGDGGGHVPAAKDLIIQRNIFRNYEAGAALSHALVLWDDSAHTLTASVLHNTFINNGSDIRAERHGAITIQDNATDSPSGTGWLLDPYDSAYTTLGANNFFSQTFDSSYYLNVGQSGRDAASDGSDAGALDSTPEGPATAARPQGAVIF